MCIGPCPLLSIKKKKNPKETRFVFRGTLSSPSSRKKATNHYSRDNDPSAASSSTIFTSSGRKLLLRLRSPSTLQREDGISPGGYPGRCSSVEVLMQRLTLRGKFTYGAVLRYEGNKHGTNREPLRFVIHRSQSISRDRSQR